MRTTPSNKLARWLVDVADAAIAETYVEDFLEDKVVVVAGVNKIVPDLEAALRRVREVAAPMRARSLGLKTPCAETGECVDCRTGQRICNVTTILHRKPLSTDLSVVIVNQELGY